MMFAVVLYRSMMIAKSLLILYENSSLNNLVFNLITQMLKLALHRKSNIIDIQKLTGWKQKFFKCNFIEIASDNSGIYAIYPLCVYF